MRLRTSQKWRDSRFVCSLFDDFIAGSKTEEVKAWLILELSKEFSTKVLGLPRLILGISLDWVPSKTPERFYDHAYLSIPKSIKAFLDMDSKTIKRPFK